MVKLALHRQFLISPIIGLVLVLCLSGAFMWHARSHNGLLLDIVDDNLRFLDRYTNLFSSLSREHIALHQLLNEASSLDDKLFETNSRKVLSDIYRSLDVLVALSKDAGGRIQAQSFSENDLYELTQHLEVYRASAMQAVEMNSVSPSMASQHLAEASKQFTYMHDSYAKKLDMARREVIETVGHNIEAIQYHTQLIFVIGLFISGLLLYLAFRAAQKLSRRLHHNLDELRQISWVEMPSVENESLDEIDQMGLAIGVFRHSLEKLDEQEHHLERNNEELTQEIMRREQVEMALLHAKSQLEEKVQLRTRSLIETNDALSDEIAQRQKAENRLYIYKKVIDHTDDAVLITDRAARIIEINPAFERILGYSKEEVIGQLPRKLKSGIHDRGFYDSMWKSLASRRHWSGEIWNKHQDGNHIPFWVTINGILGEDNEISHYIALYRDISNLKQAEEKLEKLAYFDPLTGLPNRALFNDRLIQAIRDAKRSGALLGVMFVDLDRFKDVNDVLGHAMGDALLVQVAGRLSAVLRDSDTVSRLGGDEFTIILPGIKSRTDVEHIAEKIITVLKEPFELGQSRTTIGASVGIALFPEHGMDTDKLKRSADIAMYQAKESGRNRYQLYDASLQEETLERKTLVDDMRIALQSGGFSLHYQPIVNLKTKRIDEVEGLIRWQRSEDQWVSPAEFIPVAEEHGLVADIDRWVLKAACQFAAQQNDGMMVHVNLSANLFQDEKTPKLVADYLNQTGLPAECLCLEITETAVISDPSSARQILEQIRELGVSVALDDFGTGYSSLTHLTRFPLKRLKIDRTFIASLLTDDATEAVVRSMLELAKNMDITVIAEGVEYREQHDFLVEMGCEYGQGYLYSHPLPEGDLLQVRVLANR